MTRLEKIKTRKEEWLDGCHHSPINKRDLEALIDLAEVVIDSWGYDTDDIKDAVKKFEEAGDGPGV